MHLRKVAVANLYLAVVCLFLILGNLLRFTPGAARFGNVNTGEVVLYLSAIVFTPFLGGKLWLCRAALYFIALNFFSLLIGLLKFGVDAVALAYNARLSLQLWASALVGCALFIRYSDDCLSVAEGVCKMYLAVCFLSFIILALFPDSLELWSVLASMGVVFVGDPHQYRLVSTYLDPNYFATIIVLPILFSAYMVVQFRSKKYAAITMVFLLALILSYSRSGISLLVLLCMCFGFIRLLKVAASASEVVVSRWAVVGFVIAAFTVALASFFMVDELGRMVQRFTGVFSDQSAGSRFESFKVGFDLIRQEFILGWGYNFSLKYLALKSAKLDSSVQALMISYGCLAFIATVFVSGVWYTGLKRQLCKLPEYQMKQSVTLFVMLSVYIGFAVLWAGNFNQVAFYPFWVVPVFSLASYFEIVGKFAKSGY